jgi:hypothetical protein
MSESDQAVLETLRTVPRTGQADLVHGGTRAEPDAASAFVSPEW